MIPPSTNSPARTGKPIFFYGLFMDTGLLLGKGLHPTVTGPAALNGYQIRIGTRASLLPNPEASSYGILVDLPEDEAAMLYSAADVRDYVAEEVRVTLLGDRTERTALCYNLPPERIGANRNRRYAEQLSALVLDLGLPREYAEEILRQRGA